jgi:ssDNA-binding Zn-finger/Zn-ribbon topoisomerase 1
VDGVLHCGRSGDWFNAGQEKREVLSQYIYDAKGRTAGPCENCGTLMVFDGSDSRIRCVSCFPLPRPRRTPEPRTATPSPTWSSLNAARDPLRAAPWEEERANEPGRVCRTCSSQAEAEEEAEEDRQAEERAREDGEAFYRR